MIVWINELAIMQATTYWSNNISGFAMEEFCYGSSYFFSMPLISSVGAGVNYLFTVLASIYPFILVIISHKGFTLFYCRAANVVNKNIVI